MMRHRFLRAAVVVLALVASSCAHMASVEDKKKAAANYDLAVELVHEAETAPDANASDGKYREALKELLEIVKLDPEFADAHYLLGAVYFIGFRRHTEAETALNTAVALRAAQKSEEYPEAENLLGTVLTDEGRAKEALPHFEKARTNLLYATPYFAEQEMGWALYKLGRHDDAIAHLRGALVAQPDLCGAYVKLSEVYEAKGDDKGVQNALTDFVGRCDTERLRAACGPKLLSVAWYRLAKAKARSGDSAGAGEALKTCAERFAAEPAGSECDKSLKAMPQAGG
jgi:tetratricopeptide (TPR) repeat protein